MVGAGQSNGRRPRRLRCLFVTFGLPYPPHSGARLRYFHMLRELAPECDLYLLSLLEFPDEADHAPMLRPYCRRIEMVNAPRGRWPRPIGGLWSGRPLPLQRYFTPELAQRLAEMVAAEAIDLVQIENLEMAPYVDALPASAPPIKVLVLHNVGAQQYQLPGDWPAGHGTRLRAWLKWRMLRGWDARLARRFDQIITVSALERQRLLETMAPSAERARPVAVIDNGVDVDGLQPLPPAGGPPTILFVGTLGYEPNIDAVQYFAAQVLPRVLLAQPAARFIIAGRHPAPSVRQLAQQPHISVLGEVPDLLPLYAQAQVVVVPLRAGGGTRLKVLEALALGRAVVATPIGCEGLELQDGHHLRIANGAGPLAGAVIELLGDPARREALARGGRQRVVERYAWPLMAARALALYQRLAGFDAGDRAPAPASRSQ